MTPALTLTMTDAGLARFTAAQLGEPVDLRVSSVGVTDSVFIIAPTLTALPGEQRRIETISGAQIGNDIVHLVVRDDAVVTYGVRGFGLYLADGTLFAVYGQADRIVQKSAQASNLLAIDIAFPRASVAGVTFGDTNFLLPPATSETKGLVELATDAEGAAGADPLRVPPVAVVADMIADRLAVRLPIGVVLLWSAVAATVPAGWAICDGRTVDRSDGAGQIQTPDLRDRVVVGAGGAFVEGTTFGDREKTVDTADAGAHTPTGKLPAHGHHFTGAGQAASKTTGVTLDASVSNQTAGGGSGRSVTSAALTDPGHDHAVTVSGETDAAGPLDLAMQPVAAHRHAVTIDVTQPSIALFYIMKV